MKGLLSMIGVVTRIDYQMDDFPFGSPSLRLSTPKGNIPTEKQKCQPKAQHEFTIKGVKIMDEDGRVGQLSRIVPYRSPSERFMCATLSLTLFFHMEKKDGTRDTHEVYVHGLPIKL